MLTVGLEISSAVVGQLEYVVMKNKADCTITDGNGSNAVSFIKFSRYYHQFYFSFII